jgi:hypothetical protein
MRSRPELRRPHPVAVASASKPAKSIEWGAAATEQRLEEIRVRVVAFLGRIEGVAAAAPALARVPPVEVIRVERCAPAGSRSRRTRWSRSGELLVTGKPGVTVSLPVLAESVIQFSLIRVGKHFVGFVDFLEALLRVLVTRVEVGVMLPCQLAVSLSRSPSGAGRAPRNNP